MFPPQIHSQILLQDHPHLFPAYVQIALECEARQRRSREAKTLVASLIFRQNYDIEISVTYFRSSFSLAGEAIRSSYSLVMIAADYYLAVSEEKPEPRPSSVLLRDDFFASQN